MVDFTLDEVRSLRMTEPFQLVDGKQVLVYPARFPLWSPASGSTPSRKRSR